MATDYPILTPGGRGLGYKRREGRGPLDTLELPIVLDAATLPPTVDNRHFFLPAFQQGPYGTCTCNGAASQMEYELRRQRIPVPYHRSRSYPYYYSGLIEGTTQDVGRDPHDVFTAINQHGMPPEKDWPYYPAVQLSDPPSLAAQKSASRRRFMTWADVPNQPLFIKNALAQGYSVGLAFAVWSSFESGHTIISGEVPLPIPGESLLGYHYTVIGGYTDVALPDFPASHYMVLNSWGLGVGKNGWMAFPYEFLAGVGPDNAPLVQELISLEVVTN